MINYTKKIISILEQKDFENIWDLHICVLGGFYCALQNDGILARLH